MDIKAEEISKIIREQIGSYAVDVDVAEVGSVISIGDSSDFSRTAESRSVEAESIDRNPDGLGLARGIRSAIVIQGCMFLAGYGIWHLCHLAH